MYKELEGILISGVRYNLDRDQEAVKEHPDLLDKLGSDERSSSPSVLNERVCVYVCRTLNFCYIDCYVTMVSTHM